MTALKAHEVSRYLARPDMAFEESPGTAKAIEKVFVAKEASSGAATVGGSGCGCN